MALNYLLQRHQISLMREKAAAGPEARAAHRGLATAYARRIGDLGSAAGAGIVLHKAGEPVWASFASFGEPSENPDRGFAS